MQNKEIKKVKIKTSD